MNGRKAKELRNMVKYVNPLSDKRHYKNVNGTTYSTGPRREYRLLKKEFNRGNI